MKSSGNSNRTDQRKRYTLFYFNITFLLNFTSCTLITPTFQCFHVHFPTLVSSALKKKSINKNKSDLSYLYTRWAVVKLSVVCPLNKTESSHSRTPLEAINYGELHFSISIILFKNSLPWLPVQPVTFGLGKLELSWKPPISLSLH